MIKIECAQLPGGEVSVAVECRTEDEAGTLDALYELLSSGEAPLAGWLNTQRFILKYDRAMLGRIMASNSGDAQVGTRATQHATYQPPSQPRPPVDLTAKPIPTSST